MGETVLKLIKKIKDLHLRRCYTVKCFVQLVSQCCPAEPLFCSLMSIGFYKIIRIVRALSLVNSCVQMRVWKHGCDITRILIGYVLSDARLIGW